MDRAYEGDETQQLALDLGLIPVVPPKQTRVTAVEYNRAMYKRRNEIKMAVPPAQGRSAYRLAIRTVRRHVCRMYQLRAHR